MFEKPKSYCDKDIAKNNVKVEVAKEDFENFLTELREMTAELQRRTIAERPRISGEGQVFESISPEQTAEKKREGKEKITETIWQKIHEEGFNKNNLKEFHRNIMNFSPPELQYMATSIDDLIREWDPAMHQFLRNLKKELKALLRVKEQLAKPSQISLSEP